MANANTTFYDSVRFLNFGSGTGLSAWIFNPRGGSPALDPISFSVQVYDEDGNAIGRPQSVWSDDHAVELELSDFTALSFGTLVFDFSNSAGGTVFAEYSAFGSFSVGVDSQCEVP